jgi:uracil-DNA glycosylase
LILQINYLFTSKILLNGSFLLYLGKKRTPNNMNVNIAESWKNRLQNEFEKPYFVDLVNFVKQEYNIQKIYPPGKLIFNAFDKCSFDDCKVVILGQDPYHNVGQANGLSFSVNDGVPSPPSLQNIFKEIRDDLGIPFPQTGNLERWANQGVLLLNATLTVRAGQAGSHQNKGWETFTDAIIQKISDEKEGVVFMLWGKYAQNKGSKINISKHFVLKAAHPSPMAANFGGWFGSKHFSQANNYLRGKGKEEIEW